MKVLLEKEKDEELREDNFSVLSFVQREVKISRS